MGGVIVGFTGTRMGMTAHQKEAVAALLHVVRPHTVVHGGAIGADAEFDAIASLVARACIVYPSDKSDQRAELTAEFRTMRVVRDPAPPLDRNVKIVAHSDVMIAAPAEMAERQRSGTWATIRQARKRGVPIVVVWSNGAVERG